MPRYLLRVANGMYSGTPEQAHEFQNDNEAWIEMRKICADLAGGVCRTSKPDFDWHVDLLDENGKRLFRIRIVAESLV